MDYSDFLLVALKTEFGRKTVGFFQEGDGRFDDDRLVKFKTNAYETVKAMFENRK